MSRSVLLARANLRKARGQAAVIVVLILLAALLLNLWLWLSMDYRQNFERCHDRLHAQHVTLAVDNVSGEMREHLIETMEGDEHTDAYTLDSVLQAAGVFAHNGGEVNHDFIILQQQEAFSRTIGRAEVVEEDSRIKSGVYMPVLYQSDEIAVGKTVTISFGSISRTYTVRGFFNSVMAGSHNCGLCELILTPDLYEELKGSGCATGATLCSVRLTDREEAEDYETMLKNAAAAKDPAAFAASNSYALVSRSRYISQMICSGIMSAMAFFILLIALVVIVSNIMNFIQEDMRNLGALKAVGYTSRQLVAAFLLQFEGITLAAAAAGAALSYGLFPYVNKMMVSQTGIPYEVHFLPLPLLITLFILGGAVAAAVWLAARRVRDIEPIVALRQGMQTHNFVRNYITLERTRAPLSLALALKTAIAGWKYNVTIGVTMMVLTLVVVFSGMMLENVIVDMTPFLSLVVGETADSSVGIQAECEEEFLRVMEEEPQVESLYLFHMRAVSHVGGLELVATICDDFSELKYQQLIVEGRFPKFENEIAVAVKYAGEHRLKVGDEITMTAGGKEADFIICGFTQISNNLGKDCLLTRGGYGRMGELQTVSYYIDLVQGADVDAFHKEVKERFGRDVVGVTDIKKAFDGAGAVYVSLMRVIVISALVLSLVIITFVLYLLVRTILNHKRRDYGIMKALGYTTRQLVLQTAAGLMPAVVVSTVVGLVVNMWLINPLTAAFLRGIGIVKCSFAVPVGFVAAAGAGIMVFAFAAACLMSLKIRKIAPRSLLAGE